uniref:Uncharacterized protein n=1 Tax=Orbilia oligospora TaxID=2813651 RepID=A0A6G6A519_ORBOL|nr:hypothetical protein [Orbilia oligospora]
MKKSLLSHIFYIGFTENSIYSKYELSMKVINNSVHIIAPDIFNTSKYSSDSTISFDHFPNYFTDVLMNSFSLICQNPMEQFKSIDIRYSTISNEGLDNLVGITKSISFKAYYNDGNKQIPISTIRENVLDFATESLSKVLITSPVNSQINIFIYIADPKFIK